MKGNTKQKIYVRSSQISKIKKKIKKNSSQKAATHTTYVVSYSIAKSNKALSYGEFMKQCMLQVCDILCPDKTKDFVMSVCLEEQLLLESRQQMNTYYHS